MRLPVKNQQKHWLISMYILIVALLTLMNSPSLLTKEVQYTNKISSSKIVTFSSNDLPLSISNTNQTTNTKRQTYLTGNFKNSSLLSSIFQIQVTAIHIDNAEFPLSKLLFTLTLQLAMEALEEKLRNRKVKLLLSVRSANTCSRQYACAVAAEEYYTKRTRLFIVSGCDDAIRGVSRLASNWRVPVMTAAGFGADLDNKYIHKTLIRVAFSLQTAVKFLIKVLKLFQWKSVNLIADESDANSLALKESIERHLLDFKQADFQVNLNVVSLDLHSLTGRVTIDSPTATSNGTITATQKPDEDNWPNQITNDAVRDALRQSSLFSRVNILLIPQNYLRKFMLSVYDQKMANGLYTFINMPLLLMAAATDDRTANSAFNSSRQSYTASTGENVFVWRSLHSSRNAQAKQAYESLMSIYLRTPTTKPYIYFTSKLSNLLNTESASVITTTTQSNFSPRHFKNRPAAADQTDESSRATQLNIDPYLASFYDCLLIYGSAIEETLDSIANASNSETRLRLKSNFHSNISNLVRKRRYDNMVTGTIQINENGDRETDFTLNDMIQLTGKFKPVILYKSESREIERLGRIEWSSDESEKLPNLLICHLVGPTVDSIDCRLNNSCSSKPFSKFIVTFFLLAAPLSIVMSFILYFVYKRISLESQLVDYWWKINYKDIELVATRRKQAGDGASDITGSQNRALSPEHSAKLQRQATTEISGDASSGKLAKELGISLYNSEVGKTTITKITGVSTTLASTALDVCYGDIFLGIYRFSKVALKPIPKFHQTRKLMIELRTIRTIEHSNLCRFVGIVIDEGYTALVTEFCPKGSLREFFQNESIVIDWTFKYSIINDIVAGLMYIQSSSLEYHGRLKSSNCLISSRFVVQLSDYGLNSLHDHLDKDEDELVLMKKQLWRAPEHLKSGGRGGSRKGDVYSFGLLLYEIITNNLPFHKPDTEDYTVPIKTLYNELKASGPSEKIGPDLSAIQVTEVEIEPLVELMKQCWQFDPNKRPALLVVSSGLKRITHGVTSKKLLENLTSRMEQYTNNLESLVNAKLTTLLEEKHKTEELLYQFVPQSIASRLKNGDTVEPEAFDCVTVLFSDIVGFTSLSAESSPIEVIDFLSDLYLCFDETLQQYDIFKVDTIGDAYIVASGLPQRNEGKHVIEIAQAALELRDRIASFKIPHMPGRSLQMRVGIHSGPCVAGIVGGLNMPKYCVFGDTLSIGKFMESSGLPMKLHITEESKSLLECIGDFRIETRLPKINKDGLPFQTYWLERKEN